MSSAYYSNESKDEYSSFQLVFTSRDNKIIKVKLISLNFSESEVLETVKKYSIIHKFGFCKMCNSIGWGLVLAF